MNYLERYGLSEKDINDLINQIDEHDYLQYTLNEDDICNIVDYLLSIGIINIKDLLMYKSYIFYDSLEVIKKKLVKEIVPFINEDIDYLDKIGL